MNEVIDYQHPIEKAVIPAAGLGSRMLSLTKCIPKEMLPVGGKPMLQHVVEEAVASGLKQICIVIRQGKEIIRDYFSLKNVAGCAQEENVDELKALLANCELIFAFQRHQLGLGDAVLQARDFVGTDSFVMMIPDQLMSGSKPAAAQLLKSWRPVQAIWSSLLRLPKEERQFFIGARGVDYEERYPGEVIIRRLRFPPEIFNYLGPEFINPETGEVDLLKTFEKCAEEVRIFGVWLEGEPYDLGTLPGYQRYLPKLRSWESKQPMRRSSPE